MEKDLELFIYFKFILYLARIYLLYEYTVYCELLLSEILKCYLRNIFFQALYKSSNLFNIHESFFDKSESLYQLENI